MKIVHIIGTMNTGGAERMLSNILNTDKSGNIHILMLLKKEKIKYDVPDHIRIVQFNFRKNPTVIFELFKLLKNIKKIDPDILQTWLYHSDMIGLLYKKFINKKVNLVWNIRHSARVFTSLSLKFILQKILARNSNNPDGVIFVSRDSLNKHKLIGFSNSNSIIIPNGFSKERSKEAISKEELNIPSKAMVIGHVGRYSPVKNQKIILQSFNNLCAKGYEVYLILIGRGMVKENTELLSYIDPVFLSKVILLGEQNDLDKYYKLMDMFVLSSYSEGYPNVIGESMINGTPVITTNAGDSFDIVADCGFKLNSYDQRELTEKLEEIYLNQDILVSLSIKSRDRIVNNYEIEKIVDTYKKFYRDILEGIK
jgi:glycosyltransferase involved in cell wall biosynthesis